MRTLLPMPARRVRLRCLRETTVGLFPEARIGSLLLSVEAAHKDHADSLSIEVPRSARARWREGEVFEFALFALAPDAGKLAAVERLLAGLPGAAPRRGEDIAFGDNWALESISDLDELGAFDPAALAAEARLWQDILRFRLRFTSPLRIALGQSARKGRARYARVESDVDDAALSRALTQSLVSLKFACGASDWEVPQLSLRILRKELFLVDPGHRASGRNAKPLDEGLLGEVLVEWTEPPTPAQWQHLVLLQYLGVGQGRGFGLGRMLIEQPNGQHTKLMPAGLHDALARAAAEGNVELAHRHVRGAADLRDWPGWQERENEADDCGEALADIARCDAISRALASGTVDPAHLRPVPVVKPDGGVRELLIPSFFDRVAQRALLQAIEPPLDALFADCSFGFRRGRGREQARERLLMLFRQGYVWVGETDIRKFFDEVAWWRIETRLRCLFGTEPLVPQLLRWIEAPRSDGAARTQGLPQGASLSPLLSNLMLDHLDHAVLAAGHQLVRFADDLVVLGRTQAEVEAGLALVAGVLADAGLALKLDKTRSVRFDKGFRFLGYQFVGDLAVAATAKTQQSSSLDPALAEALSPPPEAAVDECALAAGGEEPGTLLIVNEPRSTLSLRGGQLSLRVAEGEETRHAFGSLSAILMLARAQLSTEVVKAALRAGVPIHFLSDSGAWVGSTAGDPDAETLTLWQQQRERCAEPTFALAAARELVAARIASMVTLLAHRRAAQTVIDALRRLSEAVAYAASLDALRGIEGQATRKLFEAMAHLLPEGFSFESRNRRPPRDPVNALLSFGYTLLYQAAHAVLVAERLNPRIGVYHQPRGTHAALASDCIEPFRFLVERAVLSALNRRELKPDDFFVRGDGACLLTAGARRRFVLRLHERFQQPLRADGAEAAHGLYGHLQRQATMLRGMIAGGPVWRLTRFR